MRVIELIEYLSNRADLSDVVFIGSEPAQMAFVIRGAVCIVGHRVETPSKETLQVNGIEYELVR